MKQYQSKIENSWKELVAVEISESEKALLLSKEESDKEAKEALLSKIKSDREVEVSASELVLLKEKYESIKPEVNNNTYKFISADFILKDSVLSGILNYRLNNEHKQIRF